MKHGTTNTIAIAIITCLVAGTLMAAEGEREGRERDGKKHPGFGELKAFRSKQHKVRKEYFEEQREEHAEFRESLKENTPAEALPLIIANRKSQYTETKAFMQGLFDEFVAYAKEIFAKHEVPADKQEQILANMQEHRTEMEAKHDEHHNAAIAALEALQGKEDLTWEDIKAVMEANRPDHRDGKGRGHGKRKNKDKKND